MGLLDNRDDDPFGYGGMFSPLMYRSPLLGEASRGFSDGSHPAAGFDALQDGSMFRAGAAPFGFAGPGSLYFGPANDPAIQNLRTASAPAIPETEASPVGSGDGYGSPMDEAALAQQAREAAAAR